MYERSSLRYAHTNGYTSLIYTDNGEFILTCGSDGDIRKWRSIDDDDPSSNCLGEFVVCLAQKGEKLLASTDRNTVQSYTFPDMDSDGTLLRFTAPVICMKVRHEILAAGSEDTKIKVTKDDSGQPLELDGHEGPVLALDVHPKGSYLASVGGDGILKIWSLNDDAKEIKSFTGLPKINSFENAKYFGTPNFEPQTGNCLIYAKGKEICILNTTSWEPQTSLNDDKIKGDYTCCQFSKDGLFVAAGTDKGELSVFDFSTRQPKKCESPSSECQSITCVAWNSKNNEELAYCDSTGQLGTIFASGGAVGAAGDVGDLLDMEAEMADDFGDIEFADDDNDGTAGKHQQHNGHYGDGDDDDDDDGVSIEKLKSKVMSFANGGDLHDDENSKDSLGRDRSVTPSLKDAMAATNFIRNFKQQTAFQPSSTPVHLEHRYLVWNSVGIVTLHADGSDGSIDVEFHDASVHHSLHISNYNNHSMASLSSSVLAMATDDSSKLVCIALAASGNKEWSIILPDCESVNAVAATERLVAVATSMQFLRIFTVMGTQREVISIPGPVVCLAGYEDRILVCYHSAPSSEKQQYIQAMLLQTTGLKLKCQNITLPLTPERQLAWLGFSDCGSPVFSDSMGLVQLFNLKSNCWYPVCDTMKESSSVSNNYFVISLSERSQILQAVLCRGSSYPMTNPRPMVQELSLQLPFCDIESEKSTLEDAMLRASIMSMDNSEKTIKETAIKLFALSCRSEIEMRAKELIETIACTDLLMLAVKYATKLGRIHLSDRLSELLPRIEEEQQAREQEEQLVEQSLPASPLILAKAYQQMTSSSKSIAPKPLELGSSKKSAALKRFAFNNSPTASLFRKSQRDEMLATPPTSNGATSIEQESQENYASAETDTQLSSKSSGLDDTKSLTRTPLNSVNPFASKRKLSEMDRPIIMGSEKLKIIKK